MKSYLLGYLAGAAFGAVLITVVHVFCIWYGTVC